MMLRPRCVLLCPHRRHPSRGNKWQGDFHGLKVCHDLPGWSDPVFTFLTPPMICLYSIDCVQDEFSGTFLKHQCVSSIVRFGRCHQGGWIFLCFPRSILPLARRLPGKCVVLPFPALWTKDKLQYMLSILVLNSPIVGRSSAH